MSWKIKNPEEQETKEVVRQGLVSATNGRREL